MVYDPDSISAYWGKRPRAVATRIVQLLSVAGGFLSRIALDIVNKRVKEVNPAVLIAAFGIAFSLVRVHKIYTLILFFFILQSTSIISTSYLVNFFPFQFSKNHFLFVYISTDCILVNFVDRIYALLCSCTVLRSYGLLNYLN